MISKGSHYKVILHHIVDPDAFRSWAFYLGKTVRTHTGDITISRPREETDPENQGRWASYPPSGLTQDPVPVPDLISDIHRQRVMLAEIMAPVSYSVYVACAPLSLDSGPSNVLPL